MTGKRTSVAGKGPLGVLFMLASPLLGLAFALYARSRDEIGRAYELRHRSFLLADELRRETADALSLMLEPEDGQPFAAEAGQYLTHCFEIDGRVVKRAYSLSSAQGAPLATRLGWIAYFGCLGLGYIVVEIVLIQRFNLQARVERLRIVTHETNRGYGGALRSGFGHATKELVFYTDGDGQYDVKELPVLLMLMTEDTHFVNGIKTMPVRFTPTSPSSRSN